MMSIELLNKAKMTDGQYLYGHGWAMSLDEYPTLKQAIEGGE